MSRETRIVLAFGLIVIVAVGTAATGLVVDRASHDWAQVAVINGVDVDRGHLRERVAFDTYLATEEARQIATDQAAGRLDATRAAELTRLAAAPLASPAVAAADELADDELVRQLAAQQHVGAGSLDPTRELASVIGGEASRELRWIEIVASASVAPGPSSAPGASAPPVTSSPAAPFSPESASTVLASALTKLAAGTPLATVTASLQAAGWTLHSGERWLPAEGFASGPADGSVAGAGAGVDEPLDPSLVVAAYDAPVGARLGPFRATAGAVSGGALMALAPDPRTLEPRLRSDAAAGHIDDATVAAWAQAQALRAGLRQTLLAHWAGAPIEQAHVEELVLGSATNAGSGGPWVELSQLLPAQLSPSDLRSIAGAPPGLDQDPAHLAAALRGLPIDRREALFRALTTAAAAGASSASTRSGELGFFVHDQLGSALANAAFASSARSGDLLGPITTSAGPTLYLLEARYAGPLDDQLISELVDARDPSASLTSLAARFAGTNATLATDGGWRLAVEFANADPVRAALLSTPLGIRSDPVAIGDTLAILVVTERRSAPPDAVGLARLRLTGFGAWFADVRAAAHITISSDPLPELDTPTPAASLPPVPSQASSGSPGPPGATSSPVPTDVMGLPTLP